MSKTLSKWRTKHPQLSVCLPQEQYDRLFAIAKAQRYRSAAHLVRSLLADVIERVNLHGMPLMEAQLAATQKLMPAGEVTPAGKLAPRTAPIIQSTSTFIDRAPGAPYFAALPQLPGIPAGQGHPILEEPEDITAEAARLV